MPIEHSKNADFLVPAQFRNGQVSCERLEF